MTSLDRLEPDVNRLSDYEKSAETRKTYDDAVKSGDTELAERSLLEQRRQAGMATLDVVRRGGDPRYSTAPIGAFVHPSVDVERRYIATRLKQKELDTALADPNNGFHEIQKFMTGVAEQYKARNEQKIVKQPKNEEEFLAQVEQTQPVITDPNETARIRQIAVKLDQAMKAVDPTTSFFTNPKTKKWGEWLNREAGQGGVGYFTSGEQRVETGATGAVLGVAAEYMEGASEFGVNAIYGMHGLADRAVRALGGPGLPPPANYIEGPDGRPIAGSAKVPTFMDAMAMLYASATDRHMDETVTAVQETRQREFEQGDTFKNLAFGASRVIGMGFGFGLPAGAAMNVGAKSFGGLIAKGLTAAGETERNIKIAKLLGNGLGAAAANGGLEAVAYGNQEGYAKSFVHGMAMAPALMALGWMGKRTEHWLERKNMPGRLAAALSGAVEGAGFATMEAAEMGHLWEFMKNPNESTFQVYAKNMLGFMLFKGAFAQVKTPGERAFGAVAPEAMAQVSRGVAREQFAVKVSEGKATPAELESAPTKNVGALKELGDVARQRRQAKTPAEEQALREKQKGIEEELDVEELGLREGTQEEVAKAAEEPADTAIPTRDEIERVRQMPSGHEKNVALTEMMRRAKDGLREAATKYIAADSAKEMNAAKELYEAHQEVRRMAGEKKGKPFEQAIEERMADRDKAREDIKVGKRAYLENRLAELEQQERKARRLKGAPVTKITAGEEVFKPEAAEKISNEIREIRKELGFAEVGEKVSPPSLTTIESRGKKIRIAEEFEAGRGPAEATPESFERHGYKGSMEAGKRKAAEMRAQRKASEAEALRQPEQHIIPSEGKEGVPTPVSRGEKEGRKEAHAHGEEDEGGAAGAAGEAQIKNLPTGVRRGPGSMQVPPTRQLEATPGTKQVKAMHIFAEMEGRPGKEGLRIPFTARRVGGEAADPVRVPIRFGEIVAKRTLGTFKYLENLVRTKEGRDIGVGAHEWSHAMQRHMLARQGGLLPAEAGRWAASLPKEAFNEFDTILQGYPGADNLSKKARAMEVWAELFARDLLGDVNLPTAVPHLHRWAQGWLAKPEQAAIRNQYNRIKDMIRRYNEQGALGRIRQARTSPTEEKTETEKKTQPGVMKKLADAAIHGMFDDVRYLKESQKKWLRAVGKTEVDPLSDPARLYDVLTMTAGKVVGHWWKKGMRTPAGNIKSMEEIIGRVKGKVEDFTDYLMSVRNAQLIKRGKGSHLPARDWVYGVKKLQEANPEFREVARDLKMWTDHMVDYIADTGAISKESAARIKAAGVLYVPMFRAVEGPRQKPGGGPGQGGTGLTKIKGGGFEVRDPLAALQDVATSIVTKAHQYMVMKAGYKLSKHEAGGFMTKIPKDVVPHEHPAKAIIDALEKKVKPEDRLTAEGDDIFEALRDIDELNDETITLFSQKALPQGNRAIIAFTPRLTEAEINQIAVDKIDKINITAEQGKAQWFETDIKAYETLMGIDKPPTLGWLDKPVLREIIRWPAQVTRFFATGLNVGFTVANIPRDVLSYAVFSQKGEFRPLSGAAQWVRGAALYLNRTGDTRWLYDSTGVRTSSFYSEGQRRELLEQHRTFMQSTRHKIASIVDKAKSFLEAPENFLRIVEFRDAYEAAKKAGKSEMEAKILAMEAGREITVNFARAGIYSRMLNQVIPYFNAALQGQRKLWRQLALGGDGKTDAARARIQRAAFANGLVSISAPSLFLWWLNHDEEWYQDLPQWRKSLYWNAKLGDTVISLPKPFELGVLFGSVPEAIADSMYKDGNPVDAGTLMRDTFLGYLDGPAALLPAFIRPIIEGQFNYSAFFGRRLTPDWIERGRIPQEQATFYTTEIAKILSQAIGGKFTPIEIEHYLGGYTAGKSTSAFRVMDEMMGLKDHPGLAANPFGRFVKQEVHGQSRFVDDLYELSTSLDQKEGSDKLTTNDSQLKTQVDEAKRQISAIRKAHQQGRISREEANTRSYKIAKPLVERSER